MTLNVGDVIDDKYRILRLVGEGGMGAVYEGENRLIHRRVAIKVLYGAASMSQDAIQRFEREAQAAGRIGNDHILEILDLGRLPDGSRYMVMEFLDGETLGERIKRLGRLEPKELVSVFQQVLVGLQAAHDAGIVHRDLKPDNIFILKEKAGRRDFVKIIDFGISKFQDPSDHNMTRTGTVMGTPFYMSPEQAKGIGVDARSDIYAVGAMLYESVSGNVPFDGKTFNELMFKIVLSDPRPLTELVPNIDAAFASVVQKGMARDAQHRFQSSREFGDALTQWGTHGTGVTLPPENPNVVAEFGATQLPQGVAVASGGTAQGIGGPAVGEGMAAVAAAPTTLSSGTPSQGTPGAAALSATGASVGGGQTHGNWANSQPGQEPASQRKWLPFALIGAAIIVGGIVLALSGGGGGADTEAAASAEPEPSRELPSNANQPIIVQPPPAVERPKTPEPVVKPLAEVPAASSAPSEPKPAAKPAPVPAPKPSKTVSKPAPKKTTTKPKVDFGY